MHPTAKAPKPTSRQGIWYLYRRVPKRFAAIDLRERIALSTGIPIWQDPRGIRAAEIVKDLNEAMLAFWENKAAGINVPDPHYIHDLKMRARALNVTYMPNEDVLSEPKGALYQRFLALIAAWGESTLTTDTANPAILRDVHAVLGAPPEQGIKVPPPPAPAEPALMVSGMVAEYERINASVLNKKSPRQLHKWRVRRQSALDLFVTVIGGDKPFKDITRADALKLRTHWQTRINEGEVRVNSANRQLRQMSGLYSNISDYLQLDSATVFNKLRIPGGEEGKRLAFDPAFVQQHYLAEGMFDTLNDEARRLVFLIIETGLRLSEACALTPSTIILDAPVPYVDIQRINRETKTPQSVRKIPLVGVALMAMKAQPKGFPRYFDNADAASAVINKALDTKKLRPGGAGQTLYSMRHTIVDRLRAVESPINIQEEILGHKHMYGDGATLEHKHRWLTKIAFKPPSKV